MLRLVKELKKDHYAFFMLIMVNLKTNVFSTRLGVIWWLLDPLIMMSIYYFMVRIVFDRGAENYHLFALCGIVSWQCFSRSLKMASKAITSNKAIIQQIGISISMLISIPVIVQIIFAAIGFCIIVVWNYPVVGIHTLAVIPILFLIGLFGYSLALFLAIMEVWYKDINQIVGYILRVGFFLTPILYPVSRVLESEHIPEVAQLVFQINPFAWIIPAVRTVLLDGVVYKWTDYFIILTITLLITQIGLIWLRIQSPKLVKML